MSVDTDKSANPSHSNSAHWANVREKGSVLGMHILLMAYEYGGRWLFRFLLFPVVLFYFFCHPVARRASRQYRQRMQIFNPDFPAPRWWHGIRHFWGFATTLLDKLEVWRERITRADVCIHNGEIIDQLLARGQGAVILISHLGNFEICQALSEDRPNLQLTVLQHTAHAQKFNRILDRHSRETRVELMQVRDLDVGQAIHLSERLSSGQFVAISADRIPVVNAERSFSLPFLGRPTPFPTGPFILASALQAPILIVQCIKRQGRYHISFEMLREASAVPRRERSQHLERLMSGYVRNLEKHCLMAPWQWYNFYPYWYDVETNRPSTTQERS